ncbi:hypothetical protein QN277_025853 [Acacia crassicarpa]|uniref:TF-B3 domain-containing protein n=1 Tax=Acacia crassicarpa TaxID=499986 RepID=A0AAE1J6E1_9FABA|nr:hypothetical protein QN277_025853 [Acacia crassicarpa]
MSEEEPHRLTSSLKQRRVLSLSFSLTGDPQRRGSIYTPNPRSDKLMSGILSEESTECSSDLDSSPSSRETQCLTGLNPCAEPISRRDADQNTRGDDTQCEDIGLNRCTESRSRSGSSYFQSKEDMGAIKKSNLKPRSSSTLLKVQSGRVQKKVTSKNVERTLRLKRSTIDYESHAIERAKEVQANLSHEFPSLIKYMLPSHVSGGFRLGFPKHFCEMHLPKVDSMLILEDENGRQYGTKYRIRKAGLSGGWRGFSIAHNLLEGDVLVFHLIQSRMFKVFIIRSHGSNEMDVALGLLYLDGCMKQHEKCS